MNYLLVIPRFTNKPGDYYYYPLGIPYIAGSLKNAGKNVEIINLNEIAGPVNAIISEAVGKHAIDVVLTGGMSGHYTAIKNIVAASVEAKKGIITVVGGGLITAEPLVSMEGVGADIGVIGEGEATVCELADALEQGRDLAGVNGLIFRKNGGFEKTPDRAYISDLETIPWPDYEGCGFFDHLENTSGAMRELYMIASRSCPYNCTFCFHTTGRKYRQRPLHDFFRELDHMLSRYRFDFLHICDECFSLDKGRTQELCKKMKERVDKYGIGWSVQIRVDHVDRELLALLKSSGCEVISYGLESADNAILKSMRKHITIEQIENALQLTYEAGIQIHGIFIFGDIEETWETANNTLEWWKNHIQYPIHLSNIMVYPGTHLYEFACGHGIITDKLKYLEDGCPIVNISKMNDVEFRDISEKIIRYPNEHCCTPDAIEMLGVQGSGCRISIVCGACKGKHEHIYYPLYYRYLRVPAPICPHCRRRVSLDSMFMEQVLDDGFAGLFGNGRKVAVWGCGEIAGELFEKSPFLSRNDEIVIVDKSSQKQGALFRGRTVAAPTRLTDEKIDTVIVTSIQYADEIGNEIAANFPGVSKIVKITDMATLFGS